ncbi:hypothetical protein cyc_02556 [Cyclospora cayetanensis]|uniref:Uncharacterized protein n=1 Tax=Cyclospora cayetanensis TaxID=88456 RepID=A0A1D3CVF5_9EIME|nr:hypothetical protein cyc_02556 [Cyclospora cayetanensis]
MISQIGAQQLQQELYVRAQASPNQKNTIQQGDNPSANSRNSGAITKALNTLAVDRHRYFPSPTFHHLAYPP